MGTRNLYWILIGPLFAVWIRIYWFGFRMDPDLRLNFTSGSVGFALDPDLWFLTDLRISPWSGSNPPGAVCKQNHSLQVIKHEDYSAA
jgi:hypothetical protein